NASADKVISGYEILGSTVNIDISQTGTYLSLLASGKAVGSVKFGYNGTTLIDSSGPFTLFNEKHHNIVGNTFVAGGVYTITVQPFSGKNATGKAGEISTYTLNVTDSAHPPVRTSAPVVNRLP